MLQDLYLLSVSFGVLAAPLPRLCNLIIKQREKEEKLNVVGEYPYFNQKAVHVLFLLYPP